MVRSSSSARVIGSLALGGHGENAPLADGRSARPARLDTADGTRVTATRRASPDAPRSPQAPSIGWHEGNSLRAALRLSTVFGAVAGILALFTRAVATGEALRERIQTTLPLSPEPPAAALKPRAASRRLTDVPGYPTVRRTRIGLETNELTVASALQLTPPRRTILRRNVRATLVHTTGGILPLEPTENRLTSGLPMTAPRTHP